MQCEKAGKEGSAGQVEFVSLKREKGATLFPGEDAAGVGECRNRAKQGVGSCTKLIREKHKWLVMQRQSW